MVDDRKVNEDIMSERQVQSLGVLLAMVDEPYVRPCSICIVPDQLKRSNEDAYMPQIVSIGPLDRGTRKNLQYMEETKRLYMVSLLHRTTNAVENLKKCFNALLKLDAVVRASYADDIKLDRYDLARIMLFDGCFLLELLISRSESGADMPKSNYQKNIPESTWKPPEPVAIVGKMEDVLSDLTVFENQIPAVVLHTLSSTLFPSSTEEDVAFINSLALSLLGYSPGSSLNSTSNASHFLELVHLAIIGEIQESQHSSINVKSEELAEQSHGKRSEQAEQGRVELNRCATRLRAAGVTIKSQCPHCGGAGRRHMNNPEAAVTRFDFDIKFNRENGILEIPPLHIRGTTEAKWRNLIAWEHHKQNWKGKSSSIARGQGTTHGFSCKCTSSALLFNGLICCAADVQLLKDRNVIVDYLGKSNKDLLAFFHSITRGVDHGIIDSSYREMFHGLNTYSKANCATQIPTVAWHYCSQTPWLHFLYNFLKRDYNFAAALLSVLTVVQTCYAVLSYHYQK